MTVFRAEHKSDTGRDWKVEILDTDSGTFIDDLKLTSDGVNIKTNGKKRDLVQNVIGTTCKFTLYVENADHENFVLSLGTSAEGRYSVKVYLGTDLEFVGVITTDTVSIENAPKPYTFDIEANDGLKLIKKKDWITTDDTLGVVAYKSEGKFRETLHKLLIIAMNKLPTYDLYTTGDDFIKVAIDWYSEEHENNSMGTGNVLENTTVYAQTFFSKSGSQNKYLANSAYSVIEAIAIAFNMRVYQSGGVFVFEQIQLRTSSSIGYYEYDKEGTTLGTTTISQLINVNQSDNYHMNGGTISILPQLQRVDVFYRYPNSFTFDPPVEFNETRTPGFVDIGFYTLNDGTNELTVDLSILSVLSGPNLETTDYQDVVWKFRLKIGTYYLDGNQASYEWTTDTSAYFLLAYNQQPWMPYGIGGEPNQTGTTASFVTPEILEEGTIEMDLFVEYWKPNGTGGFIVTTTPPFGVTHTWYAGLVEIRPTEGVENGTEVVVQHTSEQDSGTGFREINTILGDAGVLNKPGAMAIDTSPAIKTSGWRENGVGTFLPITQLLAQTVLSLYLKNLRVYNAIIFAKTNHIRPEKKIAYDGFDLIFNNSSLDSDKDEITLEGIEIGTSTTGITNTEADAVPEVGGGGEIQGGGNDTTGEEGNDPDDPPDQNPEGLITSEPLYAGDVITTIPIVSAPGDFFGTGDVIIVQDRENGVEQQYTLTAPISENDTTASIESATVAHPTSIYSPIYISPNFIAQNRYPKYDIFVDASGADVVVTEFTLPDPAEWTVQEIRQRLHVYRQTSKLVYDVGFNIDISTNKITFAWNLSGEYVEVYFLQ